MMHGNTKIKFSLI